MPHYHEAKVRTCVAGLYIANSVSNMVKLLLESMEKW
jgi:hypothetical protein